MIELLVIIGAGLLIAVAVSTSLRMQRMVQRIDELTTRAEEAEAWTEHWEHMAEQAAEEAEAACRQYTTLQGLYARLVREQLAQNWPLVVEYRKWAKR